MSSMADQQKITIYEVADDIRETSQMSGKKATALARHNGSHENAGDCQRFAKAERTRAAGELAGGMESGPQRKPLIWRVTKLNDLKFSPALMKCADYCL